MSRFPARLRDSQQGQSLTLVFYSPSTVANAQTACAAGSGTWTSG